MQSLPAIELAVPQFAVESRPDETALAGDGALAALAGMWATIFQQQVLPAELPVEGEAWAGTTEPVQELVSSVPAAAGLMGQVQQVAPFLWSAIQQPNAKASVEMMPVADVHKMPPAEMMPVEVGVTAPQPLAAELGEVTPPVAGLERAPAVEGVGLPVESVDVPARVAVREGGALPAREPVADLAEPTMNIVAAVPNVPVAAPVVVMPQGKLQTGERTDVVEAPMQEQTPIPATNFETVVSLRKKLSDRMAPRVFDTGKAAATPVAEVPVVQVPVVTAVPETEPVQGEAQPMPPAEIRPTGESLLAVEDLPFELARVEEQEAAEATGSDVALRTVDQPKPSMEATQTLPAAPVATPVARESTEVPLASPTPPSVHPPAAPPSSVPPRPMAPVRAPEPPAPPPALAAGVPKTISIRIPLTEADRGAGSAARHIDLVFHQRNQDLTLQFHSPSSDVQRSLEASMPSLLDKLKTEDWTAHPQEAAQVPMPAEAVLESRRRGDALMPVAVQLESGREAAPVAHSSSQNFGFDESPADRNNSQQQQQQNGRNRKKEQAFQAELDEQQER